MTALDAREERVQGIEAGADDFLSNRSTSLNCWRGVRSLLRIKSLHDTVQSQSAKLASGTRCSNIA
ncbi:MAG: hypothetical protein H7X91_07660 [Burkholderiales bacterium]|nr:hypothetical protein [Burkholderiales bacterium]